MYVPLPSDCTTNPVPSASPSENWTSMRSTLGCTQLTTCCKVDALQRRACRCDVVPRTVGTPVGVAAGRGRGRGRRVGVAAGGCGVSVSDGTLGRAIGVSEGVSVAPGNLVGAEVGVRDGTLVLVAVGVELGMAVLVGTGVFVGVGGGGLP